MNERNDNPLTPEEIAARERVRALGAGEPGSGERADRAFREELRADFVSGAIVNREPLGTAGADDGAGDGAGDTGDEVEAAIYPERERGRLAPRTGRPRTGARTKRPLWYGVALATAAALLLYIALKPRAFIEVAELNHAGPIVVDGIRFAPGEPVGPVGVRGAIRPGAHVRVGEGSEFVLRFGDILLFEASSGADFKVPIVSASDPTSWSGSLEEGEVRFMTGPDFPGHTIAMSTPEGVVVVTGTMVSVYRDEGATCICVHEGTAMIGTDEENMQPVPAGRRLVLPRDADAFVDDIAPPHEKDLVDFENAWAAKYRGR